MIDHTGIRVSDIERSKRFFTEALAPLGYRVLREHPISGIGFGKERPDFWIKQGTPGPRVHVAFAAEERDIVDAFYQAALAAGGLSPRSLSPLAVIAKVRQDLPSTM